MTKFEEDQAESKSQPAGCCETERYLNSKGSCAELDITSDESFSFSLQDASSLFDEYGELILSPDTSGATDVGSAMFQDLLLCFDERELWQRQRALLNTSSASSCQPQQQRFQHMRPNLARALAVGRQENNNASTVVSQLLWQPADGGICCQSLENDQVKTQEELILYDREHSMGSEDDDNLEIHDSAPLLQPGSQLSEEDGVFEGGTLEDPRYVPRPTSISPGLREMSKFFRTLSTAEDVLAKKSFRDKDLVEDESSKLNTATLLRNPREDTRDDRIQSSPSSEEAPRTSASEAISAKAPKLTGRMTPPLGKLLQRRSRSEIKGSTGRVVPPSPPASVSGGSINGQLLQRSSSATHRRSASEDGSKRGKSSLMNFLRRSRLPSFRKTRSGLDKEALEANVEKPMVSTSTAIGDGKCEGKEVDSSVDIANILSSLEDTLQQKASKPTASSTHLAVEPQQSKPLSTQGSGETQSDTSSLFRDMEYSDDDSSSSEDSESADRFFATPYYSNENRWEKGTKTSYDQRLRRFSALGDDNMSGLDSYDTPSMISSRTELTRCSSIDTAKASNLSCDPGADRARLLEIQAYLWQQQQERERVLNAPPVEFFHEDNVIRVREAACETIDAACEIEVLPKGNLACGKDKSSSIPPTAAEF